MESPVSATPAIRAVDLGKSFGDVHALAGVSFEVPVGTVLGLLGPNGAGKTTLLKCIGGLLRASSGQVSFDGRDMLEIE